MNTEHRAILETLAFVERHGYALLFGWILAEQGALPLPSIPLLLAAGALARAGRMGMAMALVCSVAGALVADAFWFELGRQRGTRVLGFLCRIALEPDSCVQRTRNVFLKYGMKSLLVSKFVPGLNAVAAPLAGNSGSSYWQFLPYDAAGAILWSGAYLLLGYLFSEQLETILGYAAQMGSGLLILIAGLFALWLIWKFVQRRRFLRALNIARITPEELRERLDAGEEFFIVDLRTGIDTSPAAIPGAVRISTEELTAGQHEIPRDREIILFCSCPNEVSSARAAMLLKSQGITRVRPLRGGVEAWERLSNV